MIGALDMGELLNRCLPTRRRRTVPMSLEFQGVVGKIRTIFEHEHRVVSLFKKAGGDVIWTTFKLNWALLNWV